MTAMTTVPVAAKDEVHADGVGAIGSQLTPSIAPDVPLITAQEVLLGSAAVLAPRATETKAAHRNTAVDHRYLQSSRMSREMYRL